MGKFLIRLLMAYGALVVLAIFIAAVAAAGIAFMNFLKVYFGTTGAIIGYIAVIALFISIWVAVLTKDDN